MNEQTKDYVRVNEHLCIDIDHASHCSLLLLQIACMHHKSMYANAFRWTWTFSSNWQTKIWILCGQGTIQPTVIFLLLVFQMLLIFCAFTSYTKSDNVTWHESTRERVCVCVSDKDGWDWMTCKNQSTKHDYRKLPCVLHTFCWDGNSLRIIG